MYFLDETSNFVFEESSDGNRIRRLLIPVKPKNKTKTLWMPLDKKSWGGNPPIKAKLFKNN